jgi:hypothetical protein
MYSINMVFLLVVWRKNCSTLFYTYFLLLFSGKAEIQISLRNYTCFCSISAASMCKHSKNDFFTFSWRFQTGIFQTSYLLATQSALLPHNFFFFFGFKRKDRNRSNRKGCLYIHGGTVTSLGKEKPELSQNKYWPIYKRLLE